MALIYDANPLVSDLPSLDILDTVNAIRDTGDTVKIAGCLENIDSFAKALALRLSETPEGRFEDLIVTDADTGAAIAHIGSFPAGDSMLSGVATQNLWVGGDVNDPVNTAPLFTDGTTVVIGENGRVFLRNTRGQDKGFIGVQTEASKAIVSAVNNGSGKIRLGVTAHGYESGDTVDATIPGVASGTWPITVINANTFDLIGSTFSGAYTGSGVVYRYFGGAWTETFAAGNTGFTDALFRVFADSSMRIGPATGGRLTVDADGNLIIGDPAGAHLEVTSTGEVNLIDGSIFIDSSTGSTISIDALTGIRYTFPLSPNRVAAFQEDGFHIAYDETAGPKVDLGVGISEGILWFYNAAGTITAQISTSGDATFANIYHKSDVYTKAEVDSAIAAAAGDVYTKSEVDTLLAGKANTIHGHFNIAIASTSGGGVAAHTHTGSVS